MRVEVDVREKQEEGGEGGEGPSQGCGLLAWLSGGSAALDSRVRHTHIRCSWPSLVYGTLDDAKSLQCVCVSPASLLLPTSSPSSLTKCSHASSRTGQKPLRLPAEELASQSPSVAPSRRLCRPHLTWGVNLARRRLRTSMYNCYAARAEFLRSRKRRSEEVRKDLRKVASSSLPADPAALDLLVSNNHTYIRRRSFQHCATTLLVASHRPTFSSAPRMRFHRVNSDKICPTASLPAAAPRTSTLHPQRRYRLVPSSIARYHCVTHRATTRKRQLFAIP